MLLSSRSRQLIARRAAEVGLTGEQAVADARIRRSLLLSAADFALIAELPLRQVYRLAAAGALPHQRRGRRLFFSVADTLTYINPEREIACWEGPCSCRDLPRLSPLPGRSERRLSFCHGPDRFDSQT